MDPQQRLLLEAAEELLPDDCHVQRNVGVFVGCMIYPSQHLHMDGGAISLTSHSPSILSNRLSHVFDLTGPSKTLDSACASSLIALHDVELALSGQGSALVMGSSVICDHRSFLAVEGLQLLSKVDRCKTFDVLADGIARGKAWNSSAWSFLAGFGTQAHCVNITGTPKCTPHFDFFLQSLEKKHEV